MLTADSPFTFILFGASGNLAKLKIYPAIYTLALKKRLPKDYAIIGYARTDMTEQEFKQIVEDAVKTDMLEVNPTVMQDMLAHTHYVSGQYDKKEDVEKLHDKIHAVEKDWSAHVRLAYLSIPPSVIKPIVELLCETGITKHKGDFRCIVEKPVGHDLQSAEEIMKTLTDALKPDEIYFLDHYLGKESVRNVYYLRLANPILEHLLTHKLVQHVELTANETLGIGERAGYFDGVGALRDYVQSHLLQMTAMLTMDLDDKEEAIPQNRLAALKALAEPGDRLLKDTIVQGQYAAGMEGKKPVRGYLEEDGVKSGSRTNSYVALQLRTKNARWTNVPFYIRTGKRMAKKEKRISLQFLEPRSKDMGKNTSPNRIDIILEGEAGMRFVMQTKVGGTEPTFRPLVMEDPLVCVGDCLPEHGLLLLEAIRGKRTWFPDFEEIRTSWQLIDPLQKHLDDAATPLYAYEAGTTGPKESDDWIAKDGVRWF